MAQASATASHEVLRDARIGVVAEPAPEIAAIEDALRAMGAQVQSIRPGYAGWLREGSHDAVIVRVTASGEAQAGEPAPGVTEADLALLAEQQRVIALVEESMGALTVGVRDFVSAPFRPAEVVTRTARVLREPAPEVRLRAGNLELHAANRTVTVGGEPVSMTFNEFEILRALLAAGGGVVSRQSIARRAGPGDPEAVRWVDIHIHRLRAKLRGLAGASIDTVRGVGYRLSR